MAVFITSINTIYVAFCGFATLIIQPVAEFTEPRAGTLLYKRKALMTACWHLCLKRKC